jgi:hypothetical protein
MCRFATIPNISNTNNEIHSPVTTLPMNEKRNVIHRVTPSSTVLMPPRKWGKKQICIRTLAIKIKMNGTLTDGHL